MPRRKKKETTYEGTVDPDGNVFAEPVAAPPPVVRAPTSVLLLKALRAYRGPMCLTDVQLQHLAGYLAKELGDLG